VSRCGGPRVVIHADIFTFRCALLGMAFAQVLTVDQMIDKIKGGLIA
jgi:hypothetical protein